MEQLREPSLRSTIMGSTTNRYATISIKNFREEVDSIEDDKARTVIEAYYITAARLCELSAVAHPSEVKIGSTRPYGIFNFCALSDFEVSPADAPHLPKGINAVKGKAFIVTIATAKRGKHILKKNPPAPETLQFSDEQIEETLKTYNQTTLLKKWREGEEQIDSQLIKVLRGNLRFKPIAIPMDGKYEPWGLDILKHYRALNEKPRTNKFCFYLSRQEIRNIIQKNLKRILPPVMTTKHGGSHNLKNILRHWRINHLVDYYGFNPQQLATYTGWSTLTAFQKAGITGGSPTMEHYVKMAWRSYFPLLIRHVDDLMK